MVSESEVEADGERTVDWRDSSVVVMVSDRPTLHIGNVALSNALREWAWVVT